MEDTLGRFTRILTSTRGDHVMKDSLNRYLVRVTEAEKKPPPTVRDRTHPKFLYQVAASCRQFLQVLQSFLYFHCEKIK